MKRVFYLVLVLAILGIIYTACEKQNSVVTVLDENQKPTPVRVRLVDSTGKIAP